jgi:SAM-dependent methyltransferase
MFNVEFLHEIREHEYRAVKRLLPVGARVLEVGGGTGYQAKRLAEDGYAVESIDLAGSRYAGEQVFPVQPYDGRVFPFPDASFDVVFSSNVLEHVPDLGQLLAEQRRVLKPGGLGLHLMPTGVWCFATIVAHYSELGLRILRLVPQVFREPLRALRTMAGTLKHGVFIPRHGERGNAWTEIVSFSRRAWLRRFARHGVVVDAATPSGLYYSGCMLLGPRLSMPARERWASVLGSACVIYRIRHPRGAPRAPDDAPPAPARSPRP